LGRPDAQISEQGSMRSINFHRTRPDEEGILQVRFVGPGGIDYVNPADDPRKNNRRRDSASTLPAAVPE
jgi:hypothetical protein